MEELRVEPLSAARFGDLERLFRRPGDQAACWCTWWRLTPEDYSSSRAAERRELLHERAGRPPAPGLLAYAGDEPVGWVAVAPRPEHGRIPRSSVVTFEDVPGCWSVTCFYIRPDHRGRGVMTALLAAAVEHARAHGARAVEAYPVDGPGATASPGRPRRNDTAMFPGSLGVFERAGFTEVGRRRNRPTVRLAV